MLQFFVVRYGTEWIVKTQTPVVGHYADRLKALAADRSCRPTKKKSRMRGAVLIKDSGAENLWEEIREKIFKNYALKSIDAVRTKLKQAIFYIECNPETVKSITSFPYIRKSF